MVNVDILLSIRFWAIIFDKSVSVPVLMQYFIGL